MHKKIGIYYIFINVLNIKVDIICYSIFNDVIEGYIEKAKAVESQDIKNKPSNECNYFLSSATYTDIKLYIFCKQFKYMYNQLISLKRGTSILRNYDNHYAYMNYWLNDKLKSKNIKFPYSVEQFFRKIKKHDKNFDEDNFLLEKIYDIDYDVLENMRILHNLYDKYYKIYNILNGNPKKPEESCLSYFNECVNEYKKAKIKCIMDNNNFCKALKTFKDNYEQFYHMNSELINCNIEEVIKLPTDEEILTRYNNQIIDVNDKKHSTTAVVGSFIGLFSTVTLFYKVTKNIFII
ncbi:hypothetical protein PVBG_00610 [Plasmodium vivax Brazil I]|uniref:Uncharacterized protein n=1 Tax=Plasmodium vivax (strain Brazil I) TaxID=1033975 RepID=A0A0J9SKF7_PLAV1|nr:hypothetical protein PVBG_00610 [Plasmodium vivax Brazil I]